VVFYPVTAEQVSTAAVRVRVRGSAASRLESGLTPRLHQIAAEVDPGLRLGDIRASAGSSQEDIVVRLVALAVSLVIVTVLLLSAAGVYALMSFTVAQRRREIGIRTALGAPRHRVLQSIFSRVALQVGLGVLAGIAGAVIIESATGGFVLSGPRVVVIPAIALIMLAVGFFAAVGPARRGLRIQPTEALRAE
jgi:ABC-type antimicrobial peptide transport system permease subunit